MGVVGVPDGTPALGAGVVAGDDGTGAIDGRSATQPPIAPMTTVTAPATTTQIRVEAVLRRWSTKADRSGAGGGSARSEDSSLYGSDGGTSQPVSARRYASSARVRAVARSLSAASCTGAAQTKP